MVSESKEAIYKRYRYQVLHKNQHIVTSYFGARYINYENTFLKEGLQFDDSWSRYEFAKSRGQIHSHSLYFSKSHYNILKDIIDEDIDLPSKANNLERWLQSNDLNTDEVFSPFVCLNASFWWKTYSRPYDWH